MNLKPLAYFIFFLWALPSAAQHHLKIEAKLNPAKDQIFIEQTIIYKNTSDHVLREIYLFDWANSFSSKASPLAKRFAEDYQSAFHFGKERDKGETHINEISGKEGKLNWERGDEVDIVRIETSKPVFPGETYTLYLNYYVKIPSDRYTRYGVTREKEYKLRYWFLSPAVYDGKWQIYSNKNTDDLYLTPSDFQIRLHFPEEYLLTADLDEVESTTQDGTKTISLQGKNRMSAILYLNKNPDFESVITDKLEVLTDLENPKLFPPMKAVLIDRIVHFLEDRLGDYPFEKMVISESDYKTNPVYGLNLLPDFISPFPDGFEYDLEQLKTISRQYIKNTLVLHPREDYWLQNAIQIYLMMEYVETYYPNMKIGGYLSHWWPIRWIHAAKLEFNDQYNFLYLNMARQQIHQPLKTEKDSLLKFNLNIANPYHGGNGLQYLKDYLGDLILDKTLREFFEKEKLNPVSSSDFQRLLEKNTDRPVNWFFEDFAGSKSTIDFKIKKVNKKKDSLEVIIENRRNTELPVSLYGLSKDKTILKTWTAPIKGIDSITIPSSGIKKLALNNEGIIPEYNRRNNYKSLTGLLDKPLQLRPFQDVEEPSKYQLFFMPVFQYNLYDGLSPGIRLYNKTFLPKELQIGIEPQIGLKSKTFVGSGSISYTQFRNEENLFAIRYGFSGKYYSYDRDLFYKRFSPYMTFSFRPEDLRKSERQFLNIRSVNVHRDFDENDPNQDPNYNVFNAQYVYYNPGMIDYFRTMVDYQISSKFSKLSFQLEYRKLFMNNRQFNLRFFIGSFIFNDTAKDGDFFSFALDRPNDYMFDYNYYGRSEHSGLFSQQLIIAEGGFKSKLTPAYADRWIATINTSTNIWRWIYAYGDAGLVSNSGDGIKGVFDSGIRASLVTDFFEVYFPMYSNLGFEPSLPNYSERIRFIVTLSPETLFKLFSRRWY